ncbi:MAG: sigma-70 family RNA polymerase sigma factor [Phycisphaerae bacterium]|nr:sigma-70 family RNA polymerase sigma factor [Phycisphaerae bacterium]
MRTGGTTRLSFLQGLREGADSRSWVQFHRFYGELLIRYARRLGATYETAEDVAQEVTMYVFRSIGKFQHGQRKGCFRGYLRLAVVHALGRAARRESRRVTVLDPDRLVELAREHDWQDVVWQQEQYLHRIRWALRSISSEFEPATVEAFRLQVLAGESAARVAEQLGISRDCAYQAKSRVLRRLREHIAELDPDVVPD